RCATVKNGWIFPFTLYLSPSIPSILSFPTRRSSDLSRVFVTRSPSRKSVDASVSPLSQRLAAWLVSLSPYELRAACTHCSNSSSDRKSTRLNSSHDQISYAVLCLKKKISARQPKCER